MRPNELFTRADNGAARANAPGCPRSIQAVCLFEEEISIASDIVKVMGKDLVARGSLRRDRKVYYKTTTNRGKG
jgi:hypothetical protein